MSTPRTTRMIRVRRAAAISVAAVAVVLGPTACDSASAGVSGGYGAGHSHHGSEVVTVANQERDDEDDADEGAGEASEGSGGAPADGAGEPPADGAGEAPADGADEPPADGADEPPADGADEPPAEESGEPRVIAGEQVLSSTCDDSDLPRHDGFQIAPACVATHMGEVPEEANSAQLLITEAPKQVRAGEDIVLQVSTRNLFRNRFLPAGQGGYYLERSHLQDGLVRGHFHAACRLLDDTSVAPEPVRNASFIAIEDNGGGAAPDVVTVTLPALQEEGEAQCAAWAGDASHRMPLMPFANQIPAFDSVRLEIK